MADVVDIKVCRCFVCGKIGPESDFHTFYLSQDRGKNGEKDILCNLGVLPSLMNHGEIIGVLDSGDHYACRNRRLCKYMVFLETENG